MLERALRRLLPSPGPLWLALVFLAGCAVWAYRSMRVDLFPPLNFPILNVITEVPSFSSLNMERQVALPMESAASGVLGVRRVRSLSGTGIAMVSVEFEWGTDMVLARQLLSEALASVRAQLPADAEPSIENLSATLSLIEGYTLRGGGDLERLRDLAVFDLKPRLQRVAGVYKVIVMGGRAAEYAVRPDPYSMIKYDVTLDDLKTALADNNILASPGVVNQWQQELVIHTNGQFAGEGEIAGAVVAVKNGVPVRVRDVAGVRRSWRHERGDASTDGEPAVLVTVLKQPSADTGAVASGVAAEVAAFRAGLPAGLRVDNYYDQAQLVRDSIGSVKESVWIGAVLVVLVLFAFLGSLRSTVIAALSIPVSVLAALLLMRVSGVGLNIMSLGGLAIGTGIIVDDAIVVLENVFRWLETPSLSAGRDRLSLVVDAAREVFWPVVVSTAANIGIFLPMMLVEGFAGRLFAPVSATVTFALLASLAASMTVVPALAFRFLHPAAGETEGGRLAGLYAPLLERALARPRAVVAGALALVAAASVGFRRLDAEFLPSLDEGAVLVTTTLPPGASLTESRRVAGKVERWLMGVPGVVTVARRTGHIEGAEDTDTVNHSDIIAKLVPKAGRPLSIAALVDALQRRTEDLASVQVNYLMPLADKINDALGGVPADIGVDLYGQDLEALRGYADRLAGAMAKVPGLVEVRPPAAMPVPSLEVEIDKKEAGRLGVTARMVHDVLTAASDGLTATNIRLVQKEIGVVIRFREAGADLDLEALRSLPLRTAGGSTVPLEQVARLRYGSVPSEIAHDHLTRKVTVTAAVSGRSARDCAGDVARAVAALALPPGTSWAFSGKYQAQSSALSNMAQVLALAVGFVALILWLEFRSWAQVGLILLTVPLAAVGALAGLWAAGQTLNVSSMIGAVMLVGIVVRNGIMLIDALNVRRRAGDALPVAVRAAARQRLRPIVMTASVAMLGLLPLAVGWGSGSELQRPLAIAVVGGLLTSTLLTLVVLPAAALWAGGANPKAPENVG